MLTKMSYICDNEFERFLNLPNINGIGIGHKIINGYDTKIPCLTIMAVQKIPTDQLPPEAMVPKIYKDLRTDVVEVGEITPQFNSNNKGYIRPVEGGYSGSVYQASGVGTLGGLITNGTGSALSTYFLSNNHVLAETNTTTIGSAIIQPGVGDGPDTLTNQVGVLSAYVPVQFATGSTNLEDSAIGKIATSTIAVPTIVDIGVPTGIASAILGGWVQKSGRSDGYTTGTITNINATVNVNYGAAGNATFIQQIVSTAMSIPGDSGSLVLDAQNRVVGLLFAGSVGFTTVFNDIRNVLKSYRGRLAG